MHPSQPRGPKSLAMEGQPIGLQRNINGLYEQQEISEDMGVEFVIESTGIFVEAEKVRSVGCDLQWSQLIDGHCPFWGTKLK